MVLPRGLGTVGRATLILGVKLSDELDGPFLELRCDEPSLLLWRPGVAFISKNKQFISPKMLKAAE
jgi:hypothetical protein